MAILVEAFGTWVIEQFADASRKRLGHWLLGTEQERALRAASEAAIARAAVELRPQAADHDIQDVIRVLDAVFRLATPAVPLRPQETMLQALQSAMATQLAVLGDASLTGTEQSSADVLGVPVAHIIETLTRVTIQEILREGSHGGPLTPLADQLNHDLTHSKLEQQRRVLDALTGQEAPPAGPRDGGARPPPYRERVKELAQGSLHGRERELDDLCSFATGSEGYRWLVGGPWAGKTTLAVHLVQACPPEVDWVVFLVSRRSSEADAARFLQRVTAQLGWLLQAAPERPDDPAEFIDLWTQAVKRAEQTRRHLLLVVDGLDEDLGPTKGQPSVASLLPRQAGGHVHVLVLSRRFPALPDDVIDHPLCDLRTEPLTPSPHAAELAQRARQDLDEFLARRNSDPLGREVLGLLTAAEGPLTIDDLVALARRDNPQSSRPRLARLIEQEIARILEPTGPVKARRYLFAHDTLREHSQEEFGDDLARHREQLHKWATSWQQAGWPASSPRYLLDTYPALLTTHMPEHLDALYEDPAYLERAVAILSVDRVAADLHAASAVLPTAGRLSQLARVVDREAHQLRLSHRIEQPGGIARQLCMQALESGDDRLAARLRVHLARASRDQLVPQWTTRRTPAALLRTLTGHTRGVLAVAVSGNGQTTVSGGEDRVVRVWDLQQGRHLSQLRRHTSRVDAVAISADGRLAVSGSDDTTVRVWDLRENRQVHELRGHTSGVSAVAISPDGDLAVSGAGDGTVGVWDLEEGLQLGEMHRLTGEVLAVAIGDDVLLAVSGSGSTVRVWDLHRGRRVSELRGHTDQVKAVAASADGRLLVSGGHEETVRVWDLQQGRQIGELTGHASGVSALAVSGDGRWAVSGGGSATVRVWDLQKNLQVGELPGHTRGVSAVTVSADGRLVMTGFGTTVRVWDLQLARQVGELTGHASGVLALAVSGDGRLAVSGSLDKTVRVWDREQGRRRADFTGHSSGVSAVAVSRNGRWAVSGFGTTVRVWDLQESRQVSELTGHSGQVSAVAVSGDGRWAAIGSGDGALRVWDLQESRQLGELTGHSSGVLTVATSEDGRWVVSGSFDATVRVWDRQQGQQIAELTGHTSGVSAVALSGDGRWAVSGSFDGTMRVWDLEEGRQVGELMGHSGQVSVVAVSEDGRLAASGGVDETVRVWDLLTNTCLSTNPLARPATRVALIIAPNRMLTVATGDLDGMLTLYELLPGLEP